MKLKVYKGFDQIGVPKDIFRGLMNQTAERLVARNVCWQIGKYGRGNGVLLDFLGSDLNQPVELTNNFGISLTINGHRFKYKNGVKSFFLEPFRYSKLYFVYQMLCKLDVHRYEMPNLKRFNSYSNIINGGCYQLTNQYHFRGDMPIPKKFIGFITEFDGHRVSGFIVDDDLLQRYSKAVGREYSFYYFLNC